MARDIASGERRLKRRLPPPNPALFGNSNSIKGLGSCRRNRFRVGKSCAGFAARGRRERIERFACDRGDQIVAWHLAAQGLSGAKYKRADYPGKSG